MVAGVLDLAALTSAGAYDTIELHTEVGTLSSSATMTISATSSNVNYHELKILQSLYVCSIDANSDPQIAPGLELVEGSVGTEHVTNTGNTGYFVRPAFWFGFGETWHYVDKAKPIYLESDPTSTSDWKPLQQAIIRRYDGSSGDFDIIACYALIRRSK